MFLKANLLARMMMRLMLAMAEEPVCHLSVAMCCKLSRHVNLRSSSMLPTPSSLQARERYDRTVPDARLSFVAISEHDSPSSDIMTTRT